MARTLDAKVFRAYDIRGIYPRDIDGEFAGLAARGLATFLGGRRIAVSMDVRLSNEQLTKPFIDALVDSGAEVWFIGVAPTPLLYFTIARYGLDGGAAVSASHNPAEWNGFKLCGRGAKVLGWGEGMERIKELMETRSFARVGAQGELLDKHDLVFRDYEEFVMKNCRITRKLRIGVDPGNGTCAGFASGLLSRMPLEVSAINDRPDGRFPSRNPEPKPDTIGELVSLVKDRGLDFGVAFDGDGDRAIFVDDTGAVLYGDKALALFVDGMVNEGDGVVYDVSCSMAVEDAIRRKRGIPLVSKVGHSSVESRMVEEDARIGGELSGHMYFRETYYFDDAFFAAAKMAELVSASVAKLSELVAKLPAYVTEVREFDVPDSIKFKAIEGVRSSLQGKGARIIAIDGVKVMTDDGWFIVRASNTTPKVKIVAEAGDGARVAELLGTAERELDAAVRAEGGMHAARQ